MCYKIKYNKSKIRLIPHLQKKYNSLRDHHNLTSQKHLKIIIQNKSIIHFFSSQYLFYSLFNRKNKCFQRRNQRNQNCSNFRGRVKNKISFQYLLDSALFFCLARGIERQPILSLLIDLSSIRYYKWRQNEGDTNMMATVYTLCLQECGSCLAQQSLNSLN